MKIGISTVHWVHNYGAMLQSYALKCYLEEKGHAVCFTDVRSMILPSKSKPRKTIRGRSLKELLLYPKYLVKWYYPELRVLKGREKQFETFKGKYLPLLKNREESLDLIIYGSDQIWSKFTNGYDPIFLGNDGLKAKKRITFAVSMGVIDIKDEDIDHLKKALQNFNAVSVREKELQDAIIEKKLAPQLVISRLLDPVFLLDGAQWQKMIGKRIVKEPYMLFYDFQKDEVISKISERIAKTKGLRLIRITDGVESITRDANYLSTAGPLQFLSLIYFSDFVVSSSFHGTAFSLIFNKQFYASQYWNTTRVKGLLQSVGLNSRFIRSESEIDLNEIIDFDNINNIISKERERSVSFLSNFC